MITVWLLSPKFRFCFFQQCFIGSNEITVYIIDMQKYLKFQMSLLRDKIYCTFLNLSKK